MREPLLGLADMEAFSPVPPQWTQHATHSLEFGCPRCKQGAAVARNAWINRRAPVVGDNYRRKWQEFYECECGQVWWAWSSDRPPSEYARREGSDRPEG